MAESEDRKAACKDFNAWYETTFGPVGHGPEWLHGYAAGYEAAKAQAARMAKAKMLSASVRLARDPYSVRLDTSREIETAILSMTPEEPRDG